MTQILQIAELAAVTVAAAVFVGFVVRVLWKMLSGEADRLEEARKAKERAREDDRAPEDG